ncbi:MAG: PQQ-binding-like beta-propeller repeat protein [Planctomycetaceae bacterium]|nr:PQQ-binding-like beta-propeller repeat protein [Planctomycetaceae bacterium]
MLRLLLFGLSVLTVSRAVADDWPQWRGPHRDGRSAETGVDLDWTDGEPELLWKVEGLGKGYAGVAVVDGTIFTTGNIEAGQAVLARSASDGSEIWTTPVTEKVPEHSYPGARCTPTVTEKHVYAVTSNGQIACLDRSTGTLLWSREFAKDWHGQLMSGWGFSESPLVDGDRVICTPGGKDALIVALNRFTGEQIWASPSFTSDKGKDGAGYSSVVISNAAGTKQYISLTGRGVVSVSAQDGAILWTYPAVANGVANIPTPIPFGDYVFCSSGYGTGSALLHVTGRGDQLSVKEEYFLPAATLQNHHGGMILRDGCIYCGQGHNEGFPICVKVMTGEVLWGGKQRGVGKGSAAVTMVGDHLLFRYQSGHLASVKAVPDSYQLMGSFMPVYQEGQSWAHPVVADGKLYLREQNVLMCYDVRAK